MQQHPWKRLAAWLVDWLLVLAWAGVVASVGVPLYLTGVTAGLGTFAVNIIAVLVLVAPVTVALAALEAGRHQATIGKRSQHLMVTDAAGGGRLPFRRALGRNALKIALPWGIGHAAVFGIVADGAADPVSAWIWAVTAVAYIVPLVYLVALFVGAGRTPYDRLSGTSVVLTTSPQ
jgi:hypothetical protein